MNRTTNAPLTIRAADDADLANFFAYLNDHLSDNGRKGTALFMPMPRDASTYPSEREAAFRIGMQTSLGQSGWRRLWLAFDERTSNGPFIAGHIDLRARPEPAALHRAMLGMGVQRDYRKQGLGARLIGVACDWAAVYARLEWIDLEVLSVNQAAAGLYARCGFERTGEITDLFRIDGESLSYTAMSRRL